MPNKRSLKTLIYFFLTGLSLPALAQDQTIHVKRTADSAGITIIGPVLNSLSVNGTCSFKAVRIKGDTVLVDDCYDNRFNVFSPVRATSISAKPIFKAIQKKKKGDWKKLAAAVNRSEFCSPDQAFRIRITDSAGTEEIILRRYSTSGCYPKEEQKFMTDLEMYFKTLGP